MQVTATASLPQPLLRLYSKAQSRHFYTTSAAEAASAIRSGAILEGNAGQLYPDRATPGLVELHRFFRQADQDHLYTTDPREGRAETGYVEENAAGGGAGFLPDAADPGKCSVVLYRTYSAAGGHFYTTSFREARSANGTLEASYCIKP
jgi:hypothetical protein